MKRISVLLDEQVYDELVNIAKDEHRSVSSQAAIFLEKSIRDSQ